MDYYRRQELPQTYKRYKAYTEKFQEWLLATAIERNIEYQRYVEDGGNTRTSNTRTKKKKYKMPVHAMAPLAKEIVGTGAPLLEASGLNDLSDAIRARKEVTAYFRVNEQSDQGHQHFISMLVQVRNILSALTSRGTAEHDISDSRNPVIIVTTDNDKDNPNDEHEEDEQGEEIRVSESLTPDDAIPFPSTTKAKPPSSPSKGSTVIGLSAEEVVLEQKFEVLCFLYDFSHIRTFVRNLWGAFRARQLGIIHAALLTNLALATAERTVSTLASELEESASGVSIIDVVRSLHASSCQLEWKGKRSENPEYRKENTLCMEAIRHMEEFQRLIRERVSLQITPDYVAKYPLMPFLIFFNRFRVNKLKAPIMDHFTKAMRSTVTGTEPWLVFGLTIMIEVQCVFKSRFETFEEITEHNIRTCDQMRDHCEYENNMWAIGIKPDYMSVGETKFSNCFLKPSQDLSSWMNSLVEDQVATDKYVFTTNDFICMNPVLNGLVVYHFKKIYQSQSIQKTQWFMVVLCHLYNACRQVGGLSVPWPDLEFIIDTHGIKRIFVGDRPTDFEDFAYRMALGTCSSTRGLTQENRERRKHATWRRADKVTKAKRGLRPHCPLLERIESYNYGYQQDNRWIRLHNIFSYAYSGLEKNSDRDADFRRGLGPLKKECYDIASSQLQGKHMKNVRKNSRVKVPKFSSEQCLYADLLGRMQDELHKQDLHSHFDYLSFYRRAFSLVQHIRGEVLFDSSMELMRLDMKEEGPSNYSLIYNLLLGLRNKSEPDNDSLEKLQKISKIMKEFIEEGGRFELNDAQKVVDGKWWEDEDSGSDEQEFHDALEELD